MQYLSLLKSSFTERTVKMINPAWLVQLVGLRIVDKVADPKRSDLEVISALAEEGISHIEASIPHQRMISKRSINAWAKKRRTLLLTFSNPGGVSRIDSAMTASGMDLYHSSGANWEVTIVEPRCSRSARILSSWCAVAVSIGVVEKSSNECIC